MYDGVPFSGKLVKLRLKSNALSYGPIPEPDAEVEQKLEVSVKKERFHYEGTLCTDFSWQGKSVSDCLRSILDWPDLWAFAPALEEEADAGSETDDEDTLMWHTNVVREKGEP